jgi:hypothetical protein
MPATKKAPSENTAHRSAKRVAIILTIFSFARMKAALIYANGKSSRRRNFYSARKI